MGFGWADWTALGGRRTIGAAPRQQAASPTGILVVLLLLFFVRGVGGRVVVRPWLVGGVWQKRRKRCGLGAPAFNQALPICSTEELAAHPSTPPHATPPYPELLASQPQATPTPPSHFSFPFPHPIHPQGPFVSRVRGSQGPPMCDVHAHRRRSPALPLLLLLLASIGQAFLFPSSPASRACEARRRGPGPAGDACTPRPAAAASSLLLHSSQQPTAGSKKQATTTKMQEPPKEEEEMVEFELEGKEGPYPPTHTPQPTHSHPQPPQPPQPQPPTTTQPTHNPPTHNHPPKRHGSPGHPPCPSLPGTLPKGLPPPPPRGESAGGWEGDHPPE